MDSKPTIILGSTSPRRKELLELANIQFSIRKQEVDESVISTPNPAERAEQLAIHKGKHIPFENSNEIILTADTVVSLNGNIYGKPANKDEAYKMLSNLSGNVHEVYTGVSLQSHVKQFSFVEKTSVEFWPLNDQEILDYIKTEDPFDKAGAYGIQSEGAILVKQIIGDYYNVVGLPIARLVRELKNF
ncbi:Maf family protein [Ornithinibacillus halotolerans]|uniref:dTTP/UTP pyrophosphatase n=1 Tax=Ornithinibacillus halotolerans TaxID=1274357 RepID=A0A916S815_9BACI|nr:Maf family protein [Ornithinibacillus halotolerans]GGA85518.1 septum formation protein Maf [Ornithinibacillus halotolerans]